MGANDASYLIGFVVGLACAIGLIGIVNAIRADVRWHRLRKWGERQAAECEARPSRYISGERLVAFQQRMER